MAQVVVFYEITLQRIVVRHLGKSCNVGIVSVENTLAHGAVKVDAVQFHHVGQVVPFSLVQVKQNVCPVADVFQHSFVHGKLGATCNKLRNGFDTCHCVVGRKHHVTFLKILFQTQKTLPVFPKVLFGTLFHLRFRGEKGYLVQTKLRIECFHTLALRKVEICKAVHLCRKLFFR